MDRLIPVFVLQIVQGVKRAMRFAVAQRETQHDRRAPQKLGGRPYRVQKQVRRPRGALRVKQHPQTTGTDMSRFIRLMRQHAAPPIDLSQGDRVLVEKIYIATLAKDPSVQALKANKRSFVDDEVIASMTKRLLASEDSLDHDIHEIFKMENFCPQDFPARLLSVAPVLGPEVERKTYEAMLPARILATKFLLAPEMSKFWAHLMYGVRVERPHEAAYLKHSILEDDAVTARKDFLDLLALLSERLVFRWLPDIDKSSSADAMHTGSFFTAFAEATNRPDLLSAIRKRSRIPRQNMAPVQYTGYIMLNIENLLTILDRRSPIYRSVENYALFQVHLATTLVHEISHALYELSLTPKPEAFILPADIKRCASIGEHFSKGVPGELYRLIDRNKAVRRQPEPFVYTTDVTNEVGWSFERALWNGYTLTSGPDPVDNTMISMRAQFSNEAFDHPCMHTLVDRRWPRALFCRKTWDNFRGHTEKLRDYSAFDVGRYLIDRDDLVLVRYYRDRPRDQTWRMHELPAGTASIKEAHRKFKGDPREWYSRVRRKDVSEAVKSGSWREETVITTGCQAYCEGSMLKRVKAEDHDADSA